VMMAKERAVRRMRRASEERQAGQLLTLSSSVSSPTTAKQGRHKK